MYWVSYSIFIIDTWPNERNIILITVKFRFSSLITQFFYVIFMEYYIFLLKWKKLKIVGLNLLVFETVSCTTVHITTFVHNVQLSLPKETVQMPIFVFQTMVAGS